MNYLNDWKICLGIKINDYVRNTYDDASYRILDDMIIRDDNLYKDYVGVGLVNHLRQTHEYSFILDQRLFIEIEVSFEIEVATDTVVACLNATTRDIFKRKISKPEYVVIRQPRFSWVFNWISHYFEKMRTRYELDKAGLYKWNLGE